MVKESNNLQEPVANFVAKDFTSLRGDISVREALDQIREKGMGEKIIYFYVVDNDDRLAGVLPTRKLLTADLGQKLEEIMLPRVVAIPHDATLFDACEFFVLYKLLAFPVVDEERRILGIVDVNVFTQEVFDIAEREQMNEVFKSLGFKMSQVRDASPFRAFRFRFPWLLTTIGSGVICALMSSLYEATLSECIVVAFFLALVLGLGESVSIQTMTVTVQVIRGGKTTLRWYLGAVLREVGTAFLLGLASGLVAGGIVLAWRGDTASSLVIGATITLSFCSACFLGLSVPALLHSLRLDPKIAAGPVTLALSDICTLLIYFSMAAAVLR